MWKQKLFGNEIDFVSPYESRQLEPSTILLPVVIDSGSDASFADERACSASEHRPRERILPRAHTATIQICSNTGAFRYAGRGMAGLVARAYLQ